MEQLINNTSDQVSKPFAKKMLATAGWLLGSNITSQLLRLISNMVLTRLLMPEAFGLIAAVNTLYFALVMFSDLGVWQSVVKSEHGLKPEYLGTAWLIQIYRSVCLAVIILLISLSLYIAQKNSFIQVQSVYADIRLPWMFSVYALASIIQGFESMKLALAERELNGSVLARLELISQIGTMFVTISSVALTGSVWGVVCGTLAGGLIRTILSHFWLKGNHFKISWNVHYSKDLMSFGKWIFLSSLIGFLAGHGEKIILAANLSIKSYGIFSIASTLISAVMGIFSSLNGRLIFPALSHVIRENNDEQLLAVYSKVQKIADIFLGLVTGLTFMSGQWCIYFLYDDRYQSAGYTLEVLSFSLLAMRHQIVEQMMFAKNKPQLVTFNNVLRSLTLIVLIPIGHTLAGDAGAILGVVISQYVSWPLSLYFKYQHKLLNLQTEQWWILSLFAGCLLGFLANEGLQFIFN